MYRFSSVILFLFVLSGCSARQQQLEDEDARATAAASAAADAVAKKQTAEAAPRIAAELKRKEGECAADTMPIQGRMLSAIVVQKSPLYREASSQSKVIASLVLGEQVSVESIIETVGLDEKVWAHVRTNRSSDCWSYGNITGWLDKVAFVEVEDFKQVNKWDGPAHLEVEAGDWVGAYSFAADGTYGSDDYRGKLYRHGDIVLGRAEVDGQKITDVFLLIKEKGVCWAGDTSFCQKR